MENAKDCLYLGWCYTDAFRDVDFFDYRDSFMYGDYLPSGHYGHCFNFSTFL